MTKPITIAVDFDGTCVTHRYPHVGEDIGAPPVLRRLVGAGHHIILYTMRSDEQLVEAVQWFVAHNIPLYGINENPKQCMWADSPKVYANIYIDDAALGCPLADSGGAGRPFVDWPEVERALIERGVIRRVE